MYSNVFIIYELSSPSEWPNLVLIHGSATSLLKSNLITHVNTAWLAQLGEHRSAEREVSGSKPRSDQYSESLKNSEKSAAFVMTSTND